MTMSLTAQAAGLVSRANAADPLPGIGTEVNQCKNIKKCVYDFAILGGATGSVGLLDDQGNAAVFPKGAMISRVHCYVATAPLSTGSATVALKIVSASDLLTAVAKASLTLSASFTGVPLDGTASAATTYIAPLTAVAGVQISATIAVAPLSAGKLIVHVEYYDVN